MTRGIREARKRLQAKILRVSVNTIVFRRAKTEWRGVAYYYNSLGTSVCECGQRDIKKLWVIKNIQNGNRMWWIGSCCIRHFGIKRLAKESRKSILPFNNYHLHEYWGNEKENQMLSIPACPKLQIYFEKKQQSRPNPLPAQPQSQKVNEKKVIQLANNHKLTDYWQKKEEKKEGKISENTTFLI